MTSTLRVLKAYGIEVQKQRVSIEHISTNLMIVGPLTKGLSPKTFIEHVKNISIIVIDDH